MLQHQRHAGNMIYKAQKGYSSVYTGWGPQDSVQLVYKWLKKQWFMVEKKNERSYSWGLFHGL